MTRLIIIILITGVLWVQGPLSLNYLFAETLPEQVRELLRNRIEASRAGIRLSVNEESIYASVVLPRFYENRAYRPAWIDNGGPTGTIGHFVKVIREAYEEGLNPYDYHLACIETTLKEAEQGQSQGGSFNPQGLVDLELLLTDAFLIYGTHLLVGRVNPETIDPEWVANRREADMAQVLEKALASDRLEEELRQLLPPQAGYFKLRQVLRQYRDIAEKDDWPKVPGGPKMQKGDRGQRVVELRNRLWATGDLKEAPNIGGGVFDDGLEKALQRFQERHGLEADGIVGPATLVALNKPLEEGIRQIELNMERWRWLPQDLGRSYVLVNMADFRLDVIENEQTLMRMRTIVGKGYRRTPVFSEKINYLVINPYWHVPPNIAVKDKLPLIKKDSYYLAREHMRVFQGWGSDAKEIDPRTVDWSKVPAQSFKYRLVQDPGPWNALGRIKFMFPNRFNVYLHDTPSRELFEKTTRTFSSGCIRIEKPIDLAEYLLRGDPKWTREAILAAIDRHTEQTIRLPEPIPLHLLYWTAWVDERGVVQFRDDIYGRDKRLAAALQERPPSL